MLAVMDYEKHYAALIARARNRAILGYSERHHILPRCMGGGDEPSNLVDLTPEEHYVAHQLLVKMNPGNGKLAYAALAMTMKSHTHARRCNKLYGWLRRRLPDSLPEETKQRVSAATKGRPKSEAHLKSLRAAYERRRDANASRIRQRYQKYIIAR